MKRTPLVRRTPLRATAALSRTTRLSPVSRKQKARNAAYAALRPAVVERDGGLCQRCGAPGTECHHKAGRIGDRLLALDNLVLLCSACHQFLTEHPLDAIAEGYSERRVA